MSYDPVTSRMERFPEVVDRAMAKVRALEAEARRYNDRHLLTRLEAANRAWDEAIDDAQASAHAKGGSIGFGDGKR